MILEIKKVSFPLAWGMKPILDKETDNLLDKERVLSPPLYIFFRVVQII